MTFFLEKKKGYFFGIICGIIVMSQLVIFFGPWQVGNWPNPSEVVFFRGQHQEMYDIPMRHKSENFWPKPMFLFSKLR